MKYLFAYCIFEITLGALKYTGGMLMNQFAYIRVSTKEQNIERQIMALEPYNIPKKIFIVIINQVKTLNVLSIRK